MITNDAGEVGYTSCITCDSGKGPNADMDSCVQCPPGKFSHPSRTDGECITCPDGTEPNSDQADCTKCNFIEPFNTHKPTDGIMCESCGPGKFACLTTMASATYEPNEKAKGADACCDCPVNYYSPQLFGALSCHYNNFEDNNRGLYANSGIDSNDISRVCAKCDDECLECTGAVDEAFGSPTFGSPIVTLKNGWSLPIEFLLKDQEKSGEVSRSQNGATNPDSFHQDFLKCSVREAGCTFMPGATGTAVMPFVVAGNTSMSASYSVADITKPRCPGDPDVTDRDEPAYEGPLCASCAVGYTTTSEGECTACLKDGGKVLLMFFGVLLCLAVVGYIYFRFCAAGKGCSGIGILLCLGVFERIWPRLRQGFNIFVSNYQARATAIGFLRLCRSMLGPGYADQTPLTSYNSADRIAHARGPWDTVPRPVQLSGGDLVCTCELRCARFSWDGMRRWQEFLPCVLGQTVRVLSSRGHTRPCVKIPSVPVEEETSDRGQFRAPDNAGCGWTRRVDRWSQGAGELEGTRGGVE